MITAQLYASAPYTGLVTSRSISSLPRHADRIPLRRRIAAHRGLWRWLGPLLVTLLAAVLRFWNLGFPHQLVFDETYYVKDAWSLSHLGYEGAWPTGSDPLFNAGHVNGFTRGAEFVAHPPLGKWLITLGMHLAGGATSSVAWRISTAAASTLTVLLLILVTRKLLHSNLMGCLAGALLAIDGLSIVMGRTALLDGFLAPLILAAFWALLADRDAHRRWLSLRTSGIVHWNRPWLLVCGVALGAACGVKWSGLWFLAFFGVYTVVSDFFARRWLQPGPRAGQSVLQGAWNALLLVVPAAAVYVSTWTGWFLTSGGFDRSGVGGATGSWGRAVSGFLDYHRQMYEFSATLTTPHAWASNPLMWPVLWRPTLFYRQTLAQGQGSCTSSGGCVATISAIPNPLLWWTAQIAVGVLVYWAIRRRDRIAGMILLGVAAGWLPWFLYFRRTMFMFYAVAWQPFFILAVVYVLQRVLREAADPRELALRRGLVAGYLGLVLAVSVFYWPLWTGATLPYSFWAAHSWLPATWR
jgi:dolichyl-phosphate-mannose--protein O-mannosyl transferase